MDFEKRPKFMMWCNEDQWRNLKDSDLSAYNPNSSNYVPNPTDHGLTWEEWDALTVEEQSELNRKFIENIKTKQRNRIKTKAEKNLNKALNHWYNTIPQDEIISAIEKTRVFADQVIDFINEKETLPSLRNRNEELRGKVKYLDIKIRKAEDKKLRRFPRYSTATNEIIFSNHSILALWIHVFSNKY